MTLPRLDPEADTVESLQRCYGVALDEIYQLRALLAHEADTVAAHLEYATFPKSRRAVAAGQLHRMRAAARGDLVPAMQAMTRPAQALERAGADGF